MKVRGVFDDGYSKIIDCFKNNFENHGEIGASLCVYHNNRKVVDIWGGFISKEKNTPWKHNTVVPIFSTTKAIASSCLAICHSRGLINYDDKVSKHWERFGDENKQDIAIETLLQHRAGLSAIDKKLTREIIASDYLLEDSLCLQKPHWEPRAYQGYHVWTIGWYMSYLLSYIDPDNRRLKNFLEQEILPNIEGDIRVGLDEDYDWSRIAQLKPFSKIKGLFSMPLEFVIEFFKPWSLSFKSMLNPSFVSNHSNFNKKEILKLEIGSGGGVGNARGLASLFNGLFEADGPLQLKKETVDYLKKMPSPPIHGWKDKVFKQKGFRFHGGFMKPSDKHDFSKNPSSIGAFGAGGSFVFYDPEERLIVAYTMNNMSSKMMNMEREVRIRNTVYDTLATL